MGLIFAFFKSSIALALISFQLTGTLRLPFAGSRTHSLRGFKSLTFYSSSYKKAPFRVSFCNWRTEWDSNPRYPLGVHTISNRAPSASRSSVHRSCFYIAFLYLASVILKNHKLKIPHKKVRFLRTLCIMFFKQLL